MENNSKYLTSSKEDENWGLYLNVAGSTTIDAFSKQEYPPKSHPSGYLFDWNNGRILHEYQINYITKGEGILENKYGKFEVKTGSIIFTFPGEWHRYKPLKETGWKENYVGFNGSVADSFLSQGYFSPEKPVMHFGNREELLDTYLKIFDLVEKEHPGYQQIASGMIVKLLGYIISFEKRKEFSGKRIASIINEVRFTMRQNVVGEVDLKDLAQKHHVGYSYFRKMFKKYTGVSPGQYHLQLKIIRAKELLVSTTLSVKEVGLDLGFQTIHYFSLIFKKKVGMSPTEFRKIHMK